MFDAAPASVVDLRGASPDVLLPDAKWPLGWRLADQRQMAALDQLPGTRLWSPRLLLRYFRDDR